MKRVIVPLALIGEGLNENGVVRSSYTTKLIERGVIPVMVTPHMPVDMLEELYRESSGILLLGGLDLWSSCYGAAPHPMTKPGPHIRDTFEIALVRRAIADRKSLLGICRGCQILAVALGGTLHQHVPEGFPAETHQLDGVPDYALWVSTLFHEVRLAPGSRMERICGSLSVTMNSAHHQAVCSTGPDLRVTGRSPAGCIEVVEHSDPGYFCLGVQGHPEAMSEAHAGSIFSAFAEAM